jgi:Fe-S cluster biogenesis protein NfuA
MTHLVQLNQGTKERNISFFSLFTFVTEIMKKVVTVYTESTPNPASMKFVVNSFLLEEGSVEYLSRESAVNAPLAHQLLGFSGISSVFITANFITLTKNGDVDWFDLNPILREFIKQYLESGDPVFTGPREQSADPEITRTATMNPVETRIIETLEEYVKPAVEQDGGAITFKSFHEGVVTVTMKGSCSGCPSSTVTLKTGIETLLKNLIPEVKEVVAEAL